MICDIARIFDLPQLKRNTVFAKEQALKGSEGKKKENTTVGS